MTARNSVTRSQTVGSDARVDTDAYIQQARERQSDQGSRGMVGGLCGEPVALAIIAQRKRVSLRLTLDQRTRPGRRREREAQHA